MSLWERFEANRREEEARALRVAQAQKNKLQEEALEQERKDARERAQHATNRHKAWELQDAFTDILNVVRKNDPRFKNQNFTHVSSTDRQGQYLICFSWGNKKWDTLTEAEKGFLEHHYQPIDKYWIFLSPRKEPQGMPDKIFVHDYWRLEKSIRYSSRFFEMEGYSGEETKEMLINESLLLTAVRRFISSPPTHYESTKHKGDSYWRDRDLDKEPYNNYSNQDRF